jgi:hypothetical protein
MIEHRGRSTFPEKPIVQILRLKDCGERHLDRDVSAKNRILRKEHHTKASRAQTTDNAKTPNLMRDGGRLSRGRLLKKPGFGRGLPATVLLK